MTESGDLFGLNAYAYEPEYTQGEIEAMSEQTETQEDRLVASTDAWCLCENCEKMQSSDECFCCKEAEYVLPHMEDMNCITEHPQFELLVLNRDVLTVAYIQIMFHKRQQGRAPDNLTNRQSRLTAYRQFVCWMMMGEKLGKGKRIIIPACVVKTIRDKFPEEDGQYTGFKTVLDSFQDLF